MKDIIILYRKILYLLALLNMDNRVIYKIDDYINISINEDIIIEGAVWAGDDISVETHSYVHYNINTMDIQGFNFVNGISDVQKNYWRETVE